MDLKKELLAFLEVNNNFGLEKPEKVVDIYIEVCKEGKGINYFKKHEINQNKMTPKEKAEELYFKYYLQVADGSNPEYNAKQCALIAVDEILCQVNNWGIISVKGYWQQVKHELNKSE